MARGRVHGVPAHPAERAMHCIQALIGAIDVIAPMRERLPAAVVCPLPQGFALVPITDRLADALDNDAHATADVLPAKAHDMAAGVAALASALWMCGPIVRAATCFFGGTGGQQAVVWRDGEVVLEIVEDEDDRAAWPDSPISRALRRIGVVAAAGEDEFDALGLGR
ncbi:MAG: hypothetical protein ACTHOH_16585 [Lysobacteraceae bacterium]